MNRDEYRAELVEVTVTIEACRDPEDDMFLELAISGSATAIADIFQSTFPLYRQEHPLPVYLRRAGAALMHCRTDTGGGGHAEVCEEGHVNGVWYNSCRQPRTN